jgi:Domain of unknown function (DUF1707)
MTARLIEMESGHQLRVSDEDRDRAASEIREHYALGRLDADELSERLDRVYLARTRGELDALRTDLPPLSPSTREVRSELAVQRSALGRELVQQTGAALAPFLICTLVWLFSDPDGDFWPVWVLFVALIPLLRNGWHLYGPAPQLDRVAEDLARRRTSHESTHAPELPPVRDRARS